MAAQFNWKSIVQSMHDYELTQRFIPSLAGIAIAGHLAFGSTLRLFGYWESWPLRLCVVLLAFPLFFFSPEKPLSKQQKLYWEFSLLVVCPFFIWFFAFMNTFNMYWSIAIIFGGLIYGLTTKAYLLPILFPLSSIVAGYTFYLLHPDRTSVYSQAIQSLLIGAFAATIGVAIKTILEYSYKRLIEAEVHEQRANELEQTNTALRERENVIKRYVRPSVYEEVISGKDPSQFEPVIKELAIMFCDIREFTALTELLSPFERQILLNQYFSMMTHPIVENGGEVDKIMGDCVMGVFPDGQSAILAAIGMRHELQKFNQSLHNQGKPKIRNGIGIAKGKVMVGNLGSYEKLDRTVIGEAVNIAARLESKTKTYQVEIVVTQDVIQDLDGSMFHYRWIDNVVVKGSSRRLKIYEVYGHQPPEVIAFKDSTKELMEKALTIYFRKGFRDAHRLFRAMREKVPPHRFNPADKMDLILDYYVTHCEAWIQNPQITWELLEKWEGAHVFSEK